MSEFIFDLQRFGNNEGNKSDTGYSNRGHPQSGTNAGSGYGNDGHTQSGLRTAGDIVFPPVMDAEEADAFAAVAWQDYVNNVTAGTVPHYDYANGIIDSIDYSCLIHTTLENDAADVINLVDATVGNIVEYHTFRTDDTALALVFDTGAVLDFDINYVSPVFNFYNGEQMMYSTAHNRWLSGDEIAAAQSFWTGALIFSATEGVDTLYVSQATNTALLDVSATDAVVFYDVDSTEGTLLSEVTDDNLIFLFPNGKQLVVDNSTNWSPDFYFADGNVMYYNRDLDTWSYSSDKAVDDALYRSIKEQEELEAEAESCGRQIGLRDHRLRSGL